VRAARRAASRPRRPRARLDVWLVDHGQAPSREKAQALVMAGRVRVDGLPATKPGAPVRDDAQVEVRAGPAHVGRGALKLAGALDRLGVDPRGRVAVDVGASTGGFTETLLERGAARVYAVDVGRAQLHERLRADPRVVVRERESGIRVEGNGKLAAVDVRTMPYPGFPTDLQAQFMTPAADALVLVKPQFEVGRGQVGRGGIVKDPERHMQALRDVAAAARSEAGFAVAGACPSPILGSEGNREFFLHLRNGGPGLAPAALEAVLEAAVRA